MRLKMRKRLGGHVLLEALPALRTVDRLQNFGDRPGGRASAQLKPLLTGKKPIHRLPQCRPELDLAGDRALLDFAGETCVQDETVGELDRLAHALRVA